MSLSTMEHRQLLLDITDRRDSTVDFSRLTAFFYERTIGEETAYLLYQEKSYCSLPEFELIALHYLDGVEFLAFDIEQEIQKGIFQKLDAAKVLPAIKAPDFTLPSHIQREISEINDVVSIHNDWNYKIYVVENPNCFLCFAWKTTA
jgi:hypothetical protein